MVAVVVFPGSNDDQDAAWALGALGAEAVLVWHADEELPAGTGAVVLPGGFSYGDYLRCGAIARFSPVMRAVAGFAAEGGPVLGICNGFQILCEAGLLPGVLRPNASLSFVCRDVAVRGRARRAAVHLALRARAAPRDPRQARRGLLVRPAELVDELERAGQIVLRYAEGENPNGAIADVAGVVNAEGNVMGLMPHPEHAVDPLLGSGDGAMILASLVDAARERMPVARLRTQRRRDLRVLRQLAAQLLQVARPQRHRAASRRTVGGVGEAHEPLALVLEKLDHRREPPLSRPLLDGEPVDDGCRSPRCGAPLCH